MKMVENFGPIFRAARDAKGLTQKDIAKHLHLDHTYISKIENGKAPLPELDTLLKWAFYVGAKKVIESYVISYPGRPAVALPKKKAMKG